MFMSVLIVYHLLHKRLKFLQKFHFETFCTSTVGANIAKCRNISKVSPRPKQSLLFTKLIGLYLLVYEIPQVRAVSKDLKNLPTRS